MNEGRGIIIKGIARRVLPITAVILITVFSLSVSRGAEYGTEHPVSIITEEREGGMDIFLKNRTPGSFTVTVYFTKFINAEADKPLPHTMVISGNRTERCLTVKQVDKTSRWDTYFMYDFQAGVLNAVHDTGAVYSLPYKTGEGYPVMQGYDGKYTHKGEYRFSIDWDMPVGTEVLAARGGLVIETEDSFEGFGLKPYYLNRNNYINIEHPDGTIGRYVHLMKGGARVKSGQRVRAGDLIGLSGDVGYSGGPHLHFSVHRPLSGKKSESIPVKFRVSDTEALQLVEKKVYRAWEQR